MLQPAVLWGLAAVVALLSLAVRAADGQASGADAALLRAASSHQCPVTVRYDVDLGQEQNSSVPIYVGFLSVSNNQNDTIQEWKLGWTFPYNATINSQAELFSSAVVLENAGSDSPVVHSVGLNGTLAPDDSTPFPLQFLATKDLTAPSPGNQFQVAPIEDVMFNNLLCTMVAVPSQLPLPPSPAPSAGVAVKNATEVQIEYTPIDYAEEPSVDTFTQFLVRIKNIKSSDPIDLSTISMQYWLEGPETVLPYSQLNPDTYFLVRCDWATTGCGSINLQMLPGFADVPGARFLVNISMNSSAGLLMPTGENSVPALFWGKGVDVMDLLITVATRQGVATFNATQDFSYMDTPELNVDLNATIIPRRAIANPHILAYKNGQLVWGELPSSTTEDIMGVSTQAPSTESNLPLGITCDGPASEPKQRCGLAAVYCCTGPEPVNTYIPEQWPPEDAGMLPPNAGLPVVAGQPSQHHANGSSLPGPASSPSSPPQSLGAPAAAGAPTPAPASTSSSGTSKAWIAGLAAGLAVVACVAGFLAFRLRRRRRLRHDEERRVFVTDTAMIPSSIVVHKDGSNSHMKPPKSPRYPGMPDSAALEVPTAERPLILWPGLPERAAASETTSVRSSPSRQSNLPLLARQPSGGRSNLIKFGSGFSGVSSAHDNPVFDMDAEAETPMGSTQQRLVRWDSSTAHKDASPTVSKSEGSGSSPFREAPAGPSQSPAAEAEDEGITMELLAMLERKAATAPSISPQPSAAVRSPSSRHDSQRHACCRATLEPWQQRRSKSWDGTMCETHSLELIPHHLRRRKASALRLPQSMPPLASLPPPVLPNGGPLPDVDLDVDYETEIKPFMGKCLGTGGFGAVYEATWRGRRVAVKKLPQLNADQPFSEELYEGLLREIQLASKFDCDRLVRVYGACTRDRHNVCLIMELMDGGNLFQRIYDRKKRRMSYLDILQLAHDMAAGLAYLHPSVVHRDLKPQNVLLDAEGRAKLADFGISRVKDPTKSYLSITHDNGTPMYMSPEQFNGSRVDEKVDVFALGVILNECCTRRQPWKESSHFFQIILKVAINGERPWMDPDCPDPLRKLITKCWHQDPHMRPSPAEIMRLTDFMIQEELLRWEQLQRHGLAGQLPGGRLPAAARGASLLGMSPRAVSVPVPGVAAELIAEAANAAVPASAAAVPAATGGPAVAAAGAPGSGSGRLGRQQATQSDSLGAGPVTNCDTAAMVTAAAWNTVGKEAGGESGGTYAN